jgi:hypothetical protein
MCFWDLPEKMRAYCLLSYIELLDRSVRFETLTAVAVKATFFRNMSLCGLEDG